jgi:hypothetical protein
MADDERFSAFLSKFERLCKLVKCPEPIAHALLFSDRAKNAGSRQMLVDRLMEAIRDCVKNAKDYKETISYILSIDNDHHAMLEAKSVIRKEKEKGTRHI